MHCKGSDFIIGGPVDYRPRVAGPTNADVTSRPLIGPRMDGWRFQVIMAGTGSPVGTVRLEFTEDANVYAYGNDAGRYALTVWNPVILPANCVHYDTTTPNGVSFAGPANDVAIAANANEKRFGINIKDSFLAMRLFWNQSGGGSATDTSLVVIAGGRSQG